MTSRQGLKMNHRIHTNDGGIMKTCEGDIVIVEKVSNTKMACDLVLEV